jgi:hypothetical protein
MYDILTQASVVAAMAVLLIQQILKSKLIPVFFANKYPVETNIFLSVLATIVTFNWVNIDLTAGNWVLIARTLLTISIGAALSYNQLFAKSKVIQNTESVISNESGSSKG